MCGTIMAKHKVKEVNFVRQKFEYKGVLTKGNAYEKVHSILEVCRGQVEMLGLKDLADILREMSDRVEKLVKSRKEREQSLTIGPTALQTVFRQVAKELTGVEPQWLIKNPIIAAIQPIILEDNSFMLNNYQVRYALAMLTRGEDCDLTRVQRLVHRYCEHLFKLEVRRTTIKLVNPEVLGTKDSSVKVYVYKADLDNILPNKSKK
jgi:hypothetical protein